MEQKDVWELFSKTGDIDAYLKYKSVNVADSGSGVYGEYKNEGFDNKKS